MKKVQTTTTMHPRHKDYAKAKYGSISNAIEELIERDMGEPSTIKGIKDRIKEIKSTIRRKKKDLEHYQKRLENIKKRKEKKRKRMERLDKVAKEHKEELIKLDKRIESGNYDPKAILEGFRYDTGIEWSMEEFDLLREKARKMEEETEGEEE